VFGYPHGTLAGQGLTTGVARAIGGFYFPKHIDFVAVIIQNSNLNYNAMLNNTEFLTTLPATDLNRAKTFYEKKLGLKTVKSMEGEIILNGGNGSNISIYKRATPTKADHTVLTFEVNKLESEIKELESKGVKFEDYNLPDLKTENHIFKKGNEKAAWFKDTEGNILCIHEKVK
jgi:predicted enzyme related to lactoylglutathione lyase